MSQFMCKLHTFRVKTCNEPLCCTEIKAPLKERLQISPTAFTWMLVQVHVFQLHPTNTACHLMLFYNMSKMGIGTTRDNFM